jgi:SsrA-binding protein
MATEKENNNTTNIKNRKAKFEYSFLEDFTAGMQLVGTEIKSIRDAKASIAESYCVIHNDEVYVRNMYIGEYDDEKYRNHEPRRDRKLLLKKQEIKRLKSKLIDKGLTIIPRRIFINERGLAKIHISLAKGKKVYDKRETIKDRDVKRDLDRRFKK